MKKFMMLTAAATMLSTAAFADLNALITGNVMMVDGANGMVHFTFADDGTYSSDVGISGTWEVKGSDICTTRSTGESNCSAIPDGVAVGSSWDSVDATGAPVKITIMAPGSHHH